MCLTITDRNGSVHNADRDPVMPWIIRWGGKEEWRRVLLNRDGSYGHTMMTSYDEVKINLPRQVNGHWYSQLQRTLYMIVDDTVFEEMYDGVGSRDERNCWPIKAGRFQVKSPNCFALTEESNGVVHNAERDPDTPWILTLHIQQLKERRQLVADKWYKVSVNVNRKDSHDVWEMMTRDDRNIILKSPPQPSKFSSALSSILPKAAAVAGVAAVVAFPPAVMITGATIKTTALAGLTYWPKVVAAAVQGGAAGAVKTATLATPSLAGATSVAHSAHTAPQLTTALLAGHATLLQPKPSMPSMAARLKGVS